MLIANTNDAYYIVVAGVDYYDTTKTSNNDFVFILVSSI